MLSDCCFCRKDIVACKNRSGANSLFASRLVLEQHDSVTGTCFLSKDFKAAPCTAATLLSHIHEPIVRLEAGEWTYGLNYNLFTGRNPLPPLN